MNNMMPDPISPMGRAVQAKTEGMTPEQVAELDQQYAKMGLMSINDVLTLKQQLDYLKQTGQQQAGPPPTTTVAQDLQRQLNGGIAGLPANVGNESAYARGGIVSFAAGDAVYAPEDLRRNWNKPQPEMTAEEIKKHWKVLGDQKGPYAEKPVPYKQRVGKYLNKPISLKKLAGTSARGLGWLLPANMFISGVQSAGSSDVGTEELFKYYQELGTIPKDKKYDPGFWKDYNLRLLGAGDAAIASIVPDFLEQTPVGKYFGIGDPYEAIRTRKVNEAAAEAADKEKIDLSEYFEGAAGEAGAGGGAGGGAGIAGLIGNPDFSALDDIQARLDARIAAEQANIDKGSMGHTKDVQNELAALGYGNAVKEGRERLAKQEARLPEDERRGKWLSAAEGFFKMAEAAGEDGASVWGAAGAGGTAGLTAYNKLLDKIELKKEQLDQANFELAKLAEQQTFDAWGRGDARFEAARTRADNLRNQKDAYDVERLKIENEFELQRMQGQIQEAVARIYASDNKPLQEIARKYQAAADKAFMLGELPAMEQILTALGNIMVASSGTATVNMYKAQQNPIAALVAAQQTGVPPEAVATGNVQFVGTRPDR